MKKLFLIVAIMLLVSGCSNSSINATEFVVLNIDPDTVYKEINNKDVFIIDVRESNEYIEGHIQNSYNVPLSRIDDINKLMIPLDSKIIVYCHSGNRSSQAANLLIKMGYSKVYDMGGIISWNYELVN